MYNTTIFSPLALMLGCLFFFAFALRSSAQIALAESSLDNAESQTIHYKTEQSYKLFPYAPDPSKQCYHTGVKIPIDLEIGSMRRDFPDDTLKLSMTLSVEVAGGSFTISPKIMSSAFCSYEWYGAKVKASYSNANYSPRKSSTTLYVSLDLFLPPHANQSAVTGGICVVIETMDPLCSKKLPSPTMQYAVAVIGGTSVSLDFVEQNTLPLPDCTTCELNGN